MSNSSAVAQQIARSLVRSRVTDVVIAPGSRSAPLVYALGPLAEAGLIRAHVRIDERDAGFLALGLARGLRASGRESAVALVTTSGSAVANLHPAVLEASYGHLPLIAVTADRPARLRATGANQTIDDQSQVLSDVRARFDIPAGSVEGFDDTITEVVSAAMGRRGGVGDVVSGPVQLNVQFDVPLVPTEAELAQWTDEIGMMTQVGVPAGDSAEITGPVPVTITEGTVIVAGDAGGHSAESLRTLAVEHGLPVLAEPSSPLAFRPEGASTFVPSHAQVLADHPELREAIRTVIVHGKPTLTRPVAALLAETELSIQRLPDDVDRVDLEVTDLGSTAWYEQWVSAGRAISAAQRGQNSAAGDFGALARGVTEHFAATSTTLFAASSNTIRYLSDAVEINARIHASRGLAGIDGLVSTATGLSLGLGEPVVLLIGDVAMLHDVGGLLTPSAEEAGDVTVVVLNDDGGAIFSGLEHSQDHVAPYLERYFTVPHGRDFADLAAAYGWDYARVSDLAAFADAWESSADGGRGPGRNTRHLIEVALPR